MKKLFIILFAFTISSFAMAQEKTKVKEIGLTFRNLDEFGFSYKVGTEQSLWRFNALSFSGGTGHQEHSNYDYDSDSDNIGFSFSVGKEYRKLIAKKIEFRYGADLSFSYRHQKETTDYKSEAVYDEEGKNNYYSPGINMVLGVNYKINDHIIFGAEIMPHLGYSFSKGTSKNDNGEKTTRESNSFGYGFSGSSVLLSLAYRF